MPRQVSPLLHQTSPYDEFDAAAYPLDLTGWGSAHPAFVAALTQLRPKLIIEVGTWKGGSALYMAAIARKLELDCEIVCVDTFLGSHEHWLDPTLKRDLAICNGRPQLYFQFLANVVKKGMQDLITPFPISSSAAAYFFAHHGIRADLIYIDAGHEYPEVRRDIELYWPLLRAGGALLGDDFSPKWPGVMQAVKEFAVAQGLTAQVSDQKWLLLRPVAAGAAA